MIVSDTKSRAGHRRGYMYPSGDEARQNDLVRHIATDRVGVVWGVNQGGKLTVRWADIQIGEPVHGRKRYANIGVANVEFIKRDVRLSEAQVAA